MEKSAGRILVVDDEEPLRRAIQYELKSAGYQVDTAHNADAALALLKNGWDLILTDMRMPGISGLELVRKVRKRQPDAEIVVMTGYGTIETAIEAWKEGASDMIHKPFELEQILKLAAKAVKRARLRSSESFLHRLLQRPLDAILAVDLEGRIISWDAGAESLFGFADREVLGRKMLPEILPGLAADQESALKESGQTGRWPLGPGPWNTQARRKDGTYLRVGLTTLLLRNGRGLKELAELVWEEPRGESPGVGG